MAIDYTQFGKYLPSTLAGNLFFYKVPSQALLINSNVTGFPTVFNSSPNKVFVPVSVHLGFISGTTTIGSVLMAQTLNAGNSVGTGAAILTGTPVAAECSYIGGPGQSSVMQFFPTAVTFTAVPTVVMPLSLNLGAADPTNSGHDHVHNFDGKTGFYPGSAMSIVYSVTTSTSVWWMTIVGLELALPVSNLPSF